MLENSVFAVLALFLVFGAVMTVWSRQSVQSAFGFLIAMLAMAGLFALLDNSFLFLAQIMVTVGAVVVISMMVITTINMDDKKLPVESRKPWWMLLSVLLLLPPGIVMYRAMSSTGMKFGELPEGYGTLKVLGAELYSGWVLPFEIVSVLLLAAMVAAIVIARKEKAE